jgi:hypothetical protein
LLCCLSLRPPLVLLACGQSFASPSLCRSPSLMQSNTIKCCRRHQMPPSSPPLNTLSIVHLPLLPQQLSITIVKHQRPPSSISAIKC